MPLTMTRRTTIALGAAAAASAMFAPHVARAAVPFEQPPLPYADDALAPQISARTVGLHYGKHHKAYFTKLNELAPGTRYADMTLEEVVVASRQGRRRQDLQPGRPGMEPRLLLGAVQGRAGGADGAFAEAIERDFGGVDAMIAAFGKEADTVFGTGWVWLVSNDGKLSLKGYQDAGGPLPEGATPLVGIDLWEHAYYLDYENRKAEHIKAVLTGRVNWAAAGEKMA